MNDAHVTPEQLAAMNAELAANPTAAHDAQAAADDALLAALFAPEPDAPLSTGRRLRIDPRTFTLCTLERSLILDALSLHIDKLAKRGHLLASGPHSWREEKRAQLEQVDRESERACELFAMLDAVTIRSGT